MDKKWVNYTIIIYLFSYVFIGVGTALLNNNIDIKFFFAFYELLYIPIVFGLPILSIVVIFKCLYIKTKSFNIKMFFLLSEGKLIF